ncbi:UNVERIFIED_CONTAM: hypothetical protein Q9R58_19015 [Methylobacteriaceae bacterium AG10]|nr:hypothetical protein [Methylobacteriaceae bacterium AG10]
MSFLLRAALVIGALTYFALQRQEGPSSIPPRAATAGVATGDAMDRLTTGGIGALVNAVNALPPETREQVTRAGADAIARQLAGTLAGPVAPRPSADTLSASDRQPSWRGPAPH